MTLAPLCAYLSLSGSVLCQAFTTLCSNACQNCQTSWQINFESNSCFYIKQQKTVMKNSLYNNVTSVCIFIGCWHQWALYTLGSSSEAKHGGQCKNLNTNMKTLSYVGFSPPAQFFLSILMSNWTTRIDVTTNLFTWSEYLTSVKISIWLLICI